MKQRLPLLILGLAWLCVHAQTISLTGTVSDKKGSPISGATVLLKGKKLSAVTNTTGVYQITGDVLGTNNAPIISGTQKVSLRDGVLQLNLTQKSPIKIDAFDLRGNLLEHIADRSTSAGVYRINLMNHPLASKVMIVRVSVGKHTSNFRLMSLDRCLHGTASPVNAVGTKGTLAKIQDVVDVLEVDASTYIGTTVELSSLQGNNDVSLDTINLPYFSFFITSLEGLQTLSGSDDGFGGDLRLDKSDTRPGAGLRGADSICGCLAEMSMPGSRVKKWRAFLSAMKGDDDKQVNAIERIGKGPWFDYQERLFANNTDELLNDRPSNAHSDIKDNFPNEWGEYNKRPDPTKDEVDNHLTITGSNSKGRLYDPEKDAGEGMGGMMGSGGKSENPTCNDWTSTTVKSKPRAGFSWPQANSGGMGGGMGGGFGMTMSNWISVWDMSGCEAGIDLDFLTGPGEYGIYTIGNGGGYGGFYCFALDP